MIDQHVHTRYSPDSKVEITDYLKLAKSNNNKYLLITDHMDLRKDSKSFCPDYDKMFEETKHLDDVLVGVEVGYNPLCINEIKEVLSKYEFQCILLSVHDNEALHESFSWPQPTDDIDLIVRQFFQTELEAVQSGIDFDILTHLGYVYRYYDVDNILQYDELAFKVIDALIKKDAILELNTSCLNRDKPEITDFYTRLFTEYKSRGGRKVAINSDAHRLDTYEKLFKEAITLIQACGFDELTFVINRKHHLIKISELSY